MPCAICLVTSGLLAWSAPAPLRAQSGATLESFRPARTPADAFGVMPAVYLYGQY